MKEQGQFRAPTLGRNVESKGLAYAGMGVPRYAGWRRLKP